ncbi:MAG: FAD-dependent oxidoreductase [Patescibacteria group bacterium]
MEQARTIQGPTDMRSRVCDVLIVGGGVNGLATAHQINIANPNRRVVVAEQSPPNNFRASGNNTGTAHAGLYYKPGSMKAALNQIGKRMLDDFCAKNGILLDRSGKIVVARDPRGVADLNTYQGNAIANGCDPQRVRVLGQDELLERIPVLNEKTLAGLLVEETFSFPPREVLAKITEKVDEMGGDIHYNTEVLGFQREGKEWIVETNQGTFRAKMVINHAGEWADQIAKMAFGEIDWMILPIRGAYLATKNRFPDDKKFRELIYQVPTDPSLPFLDPHAIWHEDGTIHFGPTALPWLKENFAMRDKTRALQKFVRDAIMLHLQRGTWKFYLGNPEHAKREIMNVLSGEQFAKICQEIFNPNQIEITAADLHFAKAGVRAQLANRKTGKLSMDFGLDDRGNFITNKNPGSPGFTAALGLAALLSRLTESRI